MPFTSLIITGNCLVVYLTPTDTTRTRAVGQGPAKPCIVSTVKVAAEKVP